MKKNYCDKCGRHMGSIMFKTCGYCQGYYKQIRPIATNQLIKEFEEKEK